MTKSKTLPYATFQISLKTLVADKAGRVLILKARQDGSMPNYFDLPGGRINKTETTTPIVKLVTRELKEELGGKVRLTLDEVPVAIGRHVYFSKSLSRNQDVMWILFKAYYRGGKIKISDEHEGYRWVKINKSNSNIYFTKGALRVIKNYLSHKLS